MKAGFGWKGGSAIPCEYPGNPVKNLLGGVVVLERLLFHCAEKLFLRVLALA